MTAPWLETLNPAQRQAAEVVGGPALIVAGAGSGKTRVIVHRIANLILGHEVPPGRILALTFTNKAADEMKHRVASLLGRAAGPVWLGTFHRFGAQVLRAHAPLLGYTPEFTIYDDTDQVALLKRLLKERGMDETFEPKRVRAWIDNIKRAPVAEMPKSHDPRQAALRPVLEAYQARLSASNAMDFGDLLLLTHALFELHPEVLAQYRERFHYVMVDEYQDTNRIQYLLMRQLVGDRRNLLVVGDEDQSIYGWRGADIRNIRDFEVDFPDARVVLLEQNYRSTQTIIEAASELIGNNLTRKKKKLWTQNPAGEKIRVYAAEDERDEARWVVEESLRLRGLGRRLTEMAVFYRTHAQSRPLEDALRRQNVNYSVFGGPRFYDRREVKDVLAYLRLLVNPDDEVSLLRVINMPPRGVGDKTVETVTALKRDRGVPWMDAVRLAVAEGTVPARSGAGLSSFAELLAELSAPEANLKTLVQSVIARTGYQAMLEEEDTVEALARLENLAELLNAVADYAERAEAPTLAGYLEQVSLASDLDKFDATAGSLTLMTLHSAKGLEFPVVFMVGMEEGIFPHSRCLRSEEEGGEPGAEEEERRLAYVGMTRSMELLHLSWSRSKLEKGQRREMQESRFLTEIPVRFLRPIGRRSLLHSPEPPDRPAERGGDYTRRAFPERRPVRKPAREPERVSFGDSEIIYDEAEAESRPTADGRRFKAGDRVYHQDYGEGVVRGFEDQGERQKILIRFPGGSKKFLVRYVKLDSLD